MAEDSDLPETPPEEVVKACSQLAESTDMNDGPSVDADTAAEFVSEMGINAVPIAELEALVEEWREKQQHANKKKGERNHKGDYEGMANYAGMEMQAAKCANELQELIEEYDDE